MTRSRRLAGILLRDLFAFTFLYSLTGTVIFLFTGSAPLVLTSLGLVIPFGFVALTRQKLKSFILFLAAHMLLPVLPLFLPVHVFFKAVLFAFGLAASIYSVAFRLRGGYDITLALAVAGVCLNAIICLLLERFGRFGMTGILFAGACVMLLCHLISAQMDSVDSMLDILSNKAGQPLSTIRRANNASLAGFLSISALFASIAFFQPLGRFLLNIAGYILNLLRRLLIALLSLLPDNSDTPPLEETPEQQQAQPEFFFQEEAAEPSRFLEILGTIVYYLTVTALVAGVLALTFYFVYRFYRRFTETNQSGGDLREALYREPARERLAVSLRRFRRRVFFAGDEHERICRAYYKSVKRIIRGGVTVCSADTTGEIERKAPRNEEFTTLTRRYERVRYGP